MEKNKKHILWFKEIHSNDTPLVGGKTSSLGEMYNKLTPQGVRIPNGFAITAQAYVDHLKEHGLDAPLRELFTELNPKNDADLRQKSYWARQLILTAALPPQIEKSIIAAYDELGRQYGVDAIDVAVRSSATAEDLPGASFAGQQETYLNVRGHFQLINACKKCFASLFTERAISYRTELGFDHFDVKLSVCVQKMVRSDLASAGVIFTADTETGFKDVIVMSAAFGLGESVVQGLVIPDEYHVFKPSLEKNYDPILRKELGTKEYKIVYEDGGERLTKMIPVATEDREKFALADEDIITLSRWALIVEKHYSDAAQHWVPMDLEWAKDGIDGTLYLVQARPETVISKNVEGLLQEYHLHKEGRVLLEGHAVGKKIACGKVRVLNDSSERHLLQPGEILVTDKTDPDWEPVLKHAAAIITDLGSRTCHAAIVARELGIPAIVGVVGASQNLVTGQEVTVSCADTNGKIYEGILPFEIIETDISHLPRPKTNLMLNIADPSKALSLSFLPQQGVGLAREEFIVSNHVKVHPLAIAHFDKIKNPQTRQSIETLAKNHPDKKSYFVDKLAEGIAMIAAAFHPKEVILRLSDFKTNEYRNLLGGDEFEPQEENPMLGFRGASRYYHPLFKDAFALECQAVYKVRERMGLKNLNLMIPFCRTPEEGELVLKEMNAHKLYRGEDLKIYVMCEIPSNVILAKEFAEVFDGFSIGSNDLTQLILGVDRDSTLVANLFNERNPAVKTMISQVIKTARSLNKKICICGQAPSDYPEFAEYLVREGIESISLNPDSLLSTLKTVLEAEERLKT